MLGTEIDINTTEEDFFPKNKRSRLYKFYQLLSKI